MPMLKDVVQRLKRVVGAADPDQQENEYWRELTDGEIRRRVHRQFVGGMWDEIGRLQFDFMVSQGLRPEHKLLDVGCGALRGGIHFVRYLEPGHYFGIDRNRSLVRAGRVELAACGLATRGATLRVDSRFDASAFGVRFDYVLAVSLFTHLYANHIVRCLGEVKSVLSEAGKFYATFFEAPHPAYARDLVHAPGGVTTHLDSDPFHYSIQEISAYARFVGMRSDYIGEWGHPRAQIMLSFTH